MKQLTTFESRQVSGSKLDNKQLSTLVAGGVYLAADAVIVGVIGSTPHGFVMTKLALPALKLGATYAGFETANWYLEDEKKP